MDNFVARGTVLTELEMTYCIVFDLLTVKKPKRDPVLMFLTKIILQFFQSSERKMGEKKTRLSPL